MFLLIQLFHEPCLKLRPLDARNSRQRLEFDASSVQVEFMSDKLRRDKFVSQYFGFAISVTISLRLYTRIHSSAIECCVVQVPRTPLNYPII